MKKIIFMLACCTACAIFISCKKETLTNTTVNIPSSISNKAPIAVAGQDQIITLPLDSIVVNGNSSSDPDGTIISYSWSKISGPSLYNIVTPDSSKTIINKLVQGVYHIELTVKDNGGLSAKATVQITVNTAQTVSCNMQLSPFANLSIARRNVATAAAGNKILFAGGNLNLPSTGPNISSARVDIYDISTNIWSTAELSQPRSEMAVAVAGNKIFFAGGFISGATESSRVDIYDVSTNIWSTAELSIARESIAASIVGNKIYFAGGWEDYDVYDRIDIYDISTNTWSTDKLMEANSNLSAVTINNKIFYAPGWLPSNKIQIYDATLNSWSAITLRESKSYVASIAADNKIFWAGGFKGNSLFSDEVQIYDIITGTSTFHQLSQARHVTVVIMKNNKILFYGGGYPYSNRVDVYDLNTQAWSNYNVCSSVTNSSIISAGNKVYVAGGYLNGILSNQVWVLDF